MSWYRVVLIVTGCSLMGMVLGGLFGLASGTLAPTFFRHSIPWQDVEPQGVATFFGATAGVVLGGGLGCFAIIVHLIMASRNKPSGN